MEKSLFTAEYRIVCQLLREKRTAMDLTLGDFVKEFERLTSRAKRQ